MGIRVKFLHWWSLTIFTIEVVYKQVYLLTKLFSYLISKLPALF